MYRLIHSILFLAWLLPLSAQESVTPLPKEPAQENNRASPLPPPRDPFQETEDEFIKTALLRQAIKQAAGIRVLGMGHTRAGHARAILASEGKRHTLVREGDVFVLTATNGEPVEFKVSSITERGVVVVFADGTQTLLE